MDLPRLRVHSAQQSLPFLDPAPRGLPTAGAVRLALVLDPGLPAFDVEAGDTLHLATWRPLEHGDLAALPIGALRDERGLGFDGLPPEELVLAKVLQDGERWRLSTGGAPTGDARPIYVPLGTEAFGVVVGVRHAFA